MKQSIKSSVCLAFALVILLAAGREAQAQFGIKAGTYTTNLNRLQDHKLEDNTGFNAGVLYKLQLTPFFAVQPELIYVSRNACIKDRATNRREKFDTQYLQLPVSLQYGLNLVIIRPFFQIAPYVTYAVGKDFTVHDNWNDKNRFNSGIGLGGGLDLWKFQLGLRYNWDFAKSGKNGDSEDTIYTQYKLSKGRALEFSLAYIF